MSQIETLGVQHNNRLIHSYGIDSLYHMIQCTSRLAISVPLLWDSVCTRSGSLQKGDCKSKIPEIECRLYGSLTTFSDLALESHSVISSTFYSSKHKVLFIFKEKEKWILLFGDWRHLRLEIVLCCFCGFCFVWFFFVVVFWNDNLP